MRKLQSTKRYGLRYKRKEHCQDALTRFEADTLALPHLPKLLRRWLPYGRIQGDQYIALNPTREDHNPGSFQINTRNGLWADFATDDKGKGAVSLASYLFDINQQDAIQLILKEVRNGL